jgi:hypothetical protein
MATDPLQIRIARLEGGYEQIDKRMASLDGALRDLRAEFVTLRDDFRTEFGTLRTEFAALRREVHEDIQRVHGRVDLILYGLIVTTLVPIFLRVFFPK